ncbi:MAG: hypothetical protein Solumvirus1_20 [Solumvirus sp.]|uniref:Uncharacterized protein n=1 Tax=Solumvirus sp. TaxID=2487773 RepID=A0A3G5AG05_9VIRU|nr:MAG: hypothetical protein Solumvirus1_20 [Solumvirus sp.]
MAAELEQTVTYTILLPYDTDVKSNLLGPKKNDVVYDEKNVKPRYGRLTIRGSKDYLAGVLFSLFQAGDVNDMIVTKDDATYDTWEEIISPHEKENKDDNWSAEINNYGSGNVIKMYSKTRDFIDGYRYVNTEILGNYDTRLGAESEHIINIYLNNQKIDPREYFTGWSESANNVQNGDDGENESDNEGDENDDIGNTVGLSLMR